MLHKILRERYGIGCGVTKLVFVAPDLDRVGAQAGHQTGTRRSAERGLAVSTGEGYALLSQLINMRTFYHRAVVATEFGAQVVNGDK